MDTLLSQVQKRIQNEFGESVSIDFKDEKGDGKHFFLHIVSDVFQEKTRVQRSQIVYKLLDDLMTTGSIHALRMNLKTPNEI